MQDLQKKDGRLFATHSFTNSNIGDKLTFNPGDVCLVQPRNSKENVEKFLSLFSHFDPDKRFKLIINDENVQLPPDYALKNAGYSTNLR